MWFVSVWSGKQRINRTQRKSSLYITCGGYVDVTKHTPSHSRKMCLLTLKKKEKMINGIGDSQVIIALTDRRTDGQTLHNNDVT